LTKNLPLAIPEAGMGAKPEQVIGEHAENA
jgi:hypothetical protein